MKEGGAVAALVLGQDQEHSSKMLITEIEDENNKKPIRKCPSPLFRDVRGTVLDSMLNFARKVKSSQKANIMRVFVKNVMNLLIAREDSQGSGISPNDGCGSRSG